VATGARRLTARPDSNDPSTRPTDSTPRPDGGAGQRRSQTIGDGKITILVPMVQVQILASEQQGQLRSTLALSATTPWRHILGSAVLAIHVPVAIAVAADIAVGTGRVPKIR
jgi:hypothetical protein